MGKRFTGICIITDDVPKMREFYEFILNVDADGDEIHTELKTQGAGLTLFNREAMDRLAPGSMAGAGAGGYTMGFEVDDVDKEYERLGGFVTFVKEPTTYPWGSRAMWFRDPDGNIVNFYMRIENSHLL